jgi:predicted RNA-binding Zn ribbon-like protein
MDFIGYNISMALRISPIRESKLIGGKICLDFTNTVGGRSGTEVLNEKINRYDDLLVWSVYAGALQKKDADKIARFGKTAPEKAKDVFMRSIQLREAIYRIFLAVIDKNAPKRRDLEILNEEIRKARENEILERKKDGYLMLPKFTERTLDAMLWPIATCAAELLTEGKLNRLRQCDAENCGWLFVDTSKNNSRQWCDMSDCGNRAKVRRYRSRKN